MEEKVLQHRKNGMLVLLLVILAYIVAVAGLVLPAEHRLHQRASGVALVAYDMMEAGLPGDGNSLTPNYLRLSQAERERLARENR